MRIPAVAVDTVAVGVFAVIGRASHAESVDLAGVAQTAWPFVAGLVIGEVAAHALGRRRGVVAGPESLSAGVVVWVGTVAGGMALRLLSGSTAAAAFVVVASITLGVLLLGWRLVARLVRRSREPQQVA